MPDSTHILIVDDNPDNLQLLGMILEGAGFCVTKASSGMAALEKLANGLPDLVVLDVRMPGMDGYETCRRLKADERTRDIPVIFVSASTEQEERVSAFAAGGVDYVSRPFLKGEVIERVSAHASLYRIRQNLERRVALRTKELADSEARLRRLSEYLQRVREEDRRHFARELHDELGQNLTALRIDFNALAGDLGVVDEQVARRMETINGVLDATVDAVRRICEDLRPGMLDDLGLEAALASHVRRFTRQYGVQCDLVLAKEDFGIAEPISTAVFRIVQESLTNIARHAQASHAMVALEDKAGAWLLTIADDGRGLPEEANGPRQTLGILGMRERVEMLGGRLAIDSFPGRGTHIEVSLPKPDGAPR